MSQPLEDSNLAGQRAIVVASTGGHLTQAVRWADRLGFHEDSLFVTFDNPQSRSLLADRRHHFIPYVAPRDLLGVLRATLEITVLGRRTNPDMLFSTGAGVALACVPSAQILGLPFRYYESVSRFLGPSTTGRILGRVPRITRGTQHVHWASPKWPYVGSLLDDFSLTSSPYALPGVRRGLKIFVSLGTIRPYRFDRLIDSVLSALTPDDEVVWQLGATARQGLPGKSHLALTPSQFKSAALAADVVIVQSGVGAILDLFELGISPIVVPRRRAFGEHVDDHQMQVADALHARGLITAVAAEGLNRIHLEAPRGLVLGQGLSAGRQ